MSCQFVGVTPVATLLFICYDAQSRRVLNCSNFARLWTMNPLGQVEFVFNLYSFNLRGASEKHEHQIKYHSKLSLQKSSNLNEMHADASLKAPANLFWNIICYM